MTKAKPHFTFKKAWETAELAGVLLYLIPAVIIFCIVVVLLAPIAGLVCFLRNEAWE